MLFGYGIVYFLVVQDHCYIHCGKRLFHNQQVGQIRFNPVKKSRNNNRTYFGIFAEVFFFLLGKKFLFYENKELPAGIPLAECLACNRKIRIKCKIHYRYTELGGIPCKTVRQVNVLEQSDCQNSRGILNAHAGRFINHLLRQFKGEHRSSAVLGFNMDCSVHQA